MSEFTKVGTFITFGGTWNIAGIGKSYVTSFSTFTQDVSLWMDAGIYSGGIKGEAKFWFPGNGVESYLVSSATISFEGKTLSLRVNDKTAFYVPKEGRWSDWVSIRDWALGHIGEYITVTFFFSIANISAKLPTAPSAPTIPVGVSAYEAITDGSELGVPIQVADRGRLLFDVQFEGTFADSINGILPVIIGDVSIDESTQMFGNGCCKIEATSVVGNQPVNITGVTLSNPIGTNVGGFTLHYQPSTHTLYIGSEEYPTHEVVVSGDTEYTIDIEFGGEMFHVTVTVVYSELPLTYQWDNINFYQSSIAYTPTTDLKNQMKEAGFTLSLLFINAEYPTRTHYAAVFEKAVGGYNQYLFIGGLLQSVPTFVGDENIDSAIADMVFGNFSSAFALWIDNYQILRGALWIENFTPPLSPFGENRSLAEVTAGSTITIDPVPEPGDTLTLKGSASGEDVVFTFVEGYPLNDNEIQIGAPGNETAGTAANIATAINNIAGAEFVATAEDNVVTITAYTQTEFSMETDSDGLLLGEVTEIVPGFNDEEITATTVFTVAEGGKAVQEAATATTDMDGLIDGLTESISASTEFDVPMDGIEEVIEVSTVFDGLIDYMGESDD